MLQVLVSTQAVEGVRFVSDGVGNALIWEGTEGGVLSPQRERVRAGKVKDTAGDRCVVDNARVPRVVGLVESRVVRARLARRPEVDGSRDCIERAAHGGFAILVEEKGLVVWCAASPEADSSLGGGRRVLRDEGERPFEEGNAAKRVVGGVVVSGDAIGNRLKVVVRKNRAGRGVEGLEVGTDRGGVGSGVEELVGIDVQQPMDAVTASPVERVEGIEHLADLYVIVRKVAKVLPAVEPRPEPQQSAVANGDDDAPSKFASKCTGALGVVNLAAVVEVQIDAVEAQEQVVSNERLEACRCVFELAHDGGAHP
mmetsp:Transcript_21557/g.67623  ORF Transcript_21557/g.67623 Transcript_21557/m.67623 type:complete len:312 (+) Transcript_21557:344-1279(+)